MENKNIIGDTNYPTSSGAVSKEPLERKCSNDHNAYRDYRKYSYCPHCGKFIAKSLLASSANKFL